MRKIEQVRVEQRASDILDDNHQAGPGSQSGPPEQPEMGSPHCPEQSDAEQSQLNCDRQGLVVRVA